MTDTHSHAHSSTYSRHGQCLHLPHLFTGLQHILQSPSPEVFVRLLPSPSANDTVCQQQEKTSWRPPPPPPPHHHHHHHHHHFMSVAPYRICRKNTPWRLTRQWRHSSNSFLDTKQREHGLQLPAHSSKTPFSVKVNNRNNAKRLSTSS